MTGIGIDIGTRYVRVARVGGRQSPELVDLTGPDPAEDPSVRAASGSGHGDVLRAGKDFQERACLLFIHHAPQSRPHRHPLFQREITAFEAELVEFALD